MNGSRPRMMSLAADLLAVAGEDPVDLVKAALVVARIERPHLRPDASLTELRTIGARAAARVSSVPDIPVRERISQVNALLYNDERFAGNRTHYGDFRNSLLDVVLERRLGIPISLALVYMDVARAAGLEVFGVGFPGHFLLRVPADAGDERARPIILDPFEAGRELTDGDLHALLIQHAGNDAVFTRTLLQPCTSRDFLMRLLNNLKRAYVELRSFPQAWTVVDMLLALDPAALTERRDRGLLSFHLDDFTGALADLEEYVRLQRWTRADKPERNRIWDHVKTLRRRVATLN
jgi:regulator of sirC expression with transglutaminase-like and TPR domain